MTAPLHAAIAAPVPFAPQSLDRHRSATRHVSRLTDARADAPCDDLDAAREAERRAAVAAHPASGRPARERHEAMLAELLDQAYLFDDPDAYEAGVRDAFERFASVTPTG